MPYGNPLADIKGVSLPGVAMDSEELQAAKLKNALSAIQAKYLPLKTKAQAMSQIAYSNLLGPQYVAKLLGNENVLANIKDPQAKATIEQLLKTGMGMPGMSGKDSIGGSITAADFNPGGGQDNSIAGMIINKLAQMTGMGQSGGQQQNPMAQFGMMNQNPMTQPSAGNGDRAPIVDIPPEWRPKNRPTQQSMVSEPDKFIKPSPTIAENVGEFKGVKAQGEEEGKIRAKTLEEIDSNYRANQRGISTLESLLRTVDSPEFRQMRNDFPFFQDKQLWVLSKTGTPEQQQMIGQFITDTKQAVADLVNSFKGRAMEKEFNIGQQMKVSDNDTWDTMMGKMKSLLLYKKLDSRVDDLAGSMIEEQHMRPGKAYKAAMSQIDVPSVRKEIDKMMEMTVPVRNPKTGKRERIGLEEAKKRLPKEALNQLRERGYNV